MRPRIAFAVLLAVGAAMHLSLLTSSPRSLLPIAMYCAWLLLSALVAATFWARNELAARALRQRKLLRGQKVVGSRVEGLGWFAVTAAGGLAMHLLNAASASTKYSQQSGMWLLFFIFAASCSAQLRGPPGDSAAPIPDNSAVSRTATSVRVAMGAMIGCIGIGLIYLGAVSSGTPSDGLDIAIAWLFKAGGAVLALIGLALALLPKRE
jgi:hypothetical protein